jgi:glutathione S-transferase
MLKIYTAPGACSTACHIALQESGIPFEAKVVSFESNFFESKEFLKVNPKGYVPFLEIDQVKNLTEGTAILQYIAEQVPNKNLIPTQGFERFKALEWLNYVATEIHKRMGSLFAVEYLVSDKNAQVDYTKNVIEMITPKLDYVNKALEGKNFVLGNNYSVVDAYLFTILSWPQHLKIDLSPWKNIVNFQSRIYARPATQAVLKAEGVLN